MKFTTTLAENCKELRTLKFDKCEQLTDTSTYFRSRGTQIEGGGSGHMLSIPRFRGVSRNQSFSDTMFVLTIVYSNL